LLAHGGKYDDGSWGGWHAPAMRRLSQQPVECALVGVPALAVFLWWTSQAGGYFEREWMPGSLLLVVIAASSVIGQRREIARPSRFAALALAALAAYVAWSFGSILWAGTPGDALEGSQRALAFLVCFAAFVLLPWTSRTLLAALLAFVATMALIGLVTLVRLGDDTPLAERFIDGSLLGPVGYHNGSAALFTMAAVPALMLATRRELAPWLRPLLLAGATLLLGLAALGQSRGLLLTVPLIAIAALVLSPDRLKLVLFALPVLAALALVVPDILAVGRAGSGVAPAAAEPAMRPALDRAVTLLGLVTVATLVLAVGLLAAERRWAARTGLPAAARWRLSIALAAAVVVSAGAGATIASGSDPLERLDRAWTQFTDVEYQDTTSTGLGSGRYDFWRVALEVWRAHPLQGAGQDNFIELYDAHGRTQEQPRWVHSLPLRLLTHTGLLGAVLFVAFVLAVGRGAASAWCKARDRAACAVIGAALMPGIVWLAHGAVDWLWEVPALSLVAFALSGAVVALGRRDAPAPRPLRAQRLIAAAAGAAIVVVGAAIAPAFVADREVALALQTDDRALADARLDRARVLNPLSAAPGLAQGRIAQRRGDLRRARSGFAEAARRSLDAWYPRFALGLVASAAGDRAAARRQLLAARARAPREPLIADALRRVDGRRPLGFAEAQRRRDEQRRIQRTQGG
jgi:hypothetical protein